jgi:hypothetical protein
MQLFTSSRSVQQLERLLEDDPSPETHARVFALLVNQSILPFPIALLKDGLEPSHMFRRYDSTGERIISHPCIIFACIITISINA